jgi:hypothetical protein
MISKKRLIAFALVLLMLSAFLPAIGHARNILEYAENYGKIKRIYARSDGIYFRLKDGKTSALGAKGYYVLEKAHANYNALANLLYLVADKNWVVKVRCPDTPYHGPVELPNRAVVYLVVDR